MARLLFGTPSDLMLFSMISKYNAVEEWLVFMSYSESITVWSLDVLSFFLWIFSSYSSFFLQSKNMLMVRSVLIDVYPYLRLCDVIRLCRRLLGLAPVSTATLKRLEQCNMNEWCQTLADYCPAGAQSCQSWNWITKAWALELMTFNWPFSNAAPRAWKRRSHRQKHMSAKDVQLGFWFISTNASQCYTHTPDTSRSLDIML